MIALVPLSMAVAVLVLPSARVARHRLAAIRVDAVGGGADASRQRGAWVLPSALAGALGLLTVAIGTSTTAALAGVAVASIVWPVARRWLRQGRTMAADPLRLAANWDLLAACLRAGLAVPVAIRAVADRLPPGPADALRAAADLLALGADPTEAWEPALRQPGTAELARGARRTARSGAALAGVASTVAGRVRASAGDLAEARAQRAAVLIAGPLGLCFLPAFMCLGVLPVVIGLAARFEFSF